jgi:cyclase
MDAVASLYGRNSLLDVIEKTASEMFVPLTVGGGLRSLDDISAALDSGADKVSINTAALQRPELIGEAARKFGSSTIVVSIDAKRTPRGDWRAYVDNGRDDSGQDAVAWARRAADLGAGELLLTSIDQEGTGLGFDLELVQQIAPSVPIPVIACGGAGSVGDVVAVVQEGQADAVSVASILHYGFARELEQRGVEFGGAGGFEVIRERRNFERVSVSDIREIKARLAGAGVACRPIPASRHEAVATR